MKQTTKIIVIIAFAFVFFLVFGLIVATRKSSGHSTPGAFGFILLVGLIAAIRAVWKYNPNKKDDKLVEQNNDDKHHLDKT